MKLTSGDVVRLDLGVPSGSEARLFRPAVVVTAEQILTEHPQVIQVVPLTSRLRGYASEVPVEADQDNGLAADSSAQCQHIRAVARLRVRDRLGNVGPVLLAEIRETLAALLDA